MERRRLTPAGGEETSKRRRASRLLLAGLAVAALLLAPAALASRGDQALDPAAKPAPETPPAADLAICGDAAKAELPPGSAVDVAEFAQRLHGTWRLGSRTIRGLPIDARAKFYFDIEKISDDKATGSAILIDYGNLSVLDPLGLTAECRADATVAALWELEVRRDNDHRVSLIMAGEYFGSYGDLLKGITATETSSYYHYGSSYLSGKLATPSGGEVFPADIWDRVDLTSETLTYVSCKNGYIERYFKISEGKPALDGLPLREGWAHRRESGSLTVPVPVPSIWRDSPTTSSSGE